MRILKLFFSLLTFFYLACLVYPSFAFAQNILFQNDNIAEERDFLPCTDAGSSDPDSGCGSGEDVFTIQCALISNDEYPDCVVVTSSGSVLSGNSIDFGFLLNRGLAADSGSNQFETVSNIVTSEYDITVSSTNANLALRNMTPSGLPGSTITTGVDGNNGGDPVIISAVAAGQDFESAVIALSDADGFIAGDLSNLRDYTIQVGPGSSLESPATTMSNSALIDCDGDNDLDLVVLTSIASPAASQPVNIRVNHNQSNILSNAIIANASNVVTLSNVSLETAMIPGDFNGDGIPDLAVTVNSGTIAANGVYVCSGNGSANSCTFNCSEAVNFFDDPISGDSDVNPGSIAAGDFDGDGFYDVAFSILPDVSEPRIVYIFGDGNSLDASTLSVEVPVPGLQELEVTQIVSGDFNGDSIDDLAFALSDATPDSGNDAVIQAFVSDVDNLRSFSGVDQKQFLDINTGFGVANEHHSADSLDVVDIDLCGGDDVVAIYSDSAASITANSRRLAVWWNRNEPPEASILPTVPAVPVIGIGGSLDISALCSDPTQDERSYVFSTGCLEASLSNTSGTIARGETDPSISTRLTVSSTLGNCTVLLQCTDKCGISTFSNSTFLTVVPQVCGDYAVQEGEACDAGPAGNTACSASCEVIAVTQGGTLWNSCSLNTSPENLGNLKANFHLYIFCIFSLLTLLFLRFKKRQFSGVKLFLSIFTIILFAQVNNSEALTNSFNVNTFKPTFDDSEFFGIYRSKALRQRDYHLGFWLDYSSKSYEFGAANFERVSGVVDSLLTANFLGAYGITDWLTVGGRLPVHLYQNLNSPSLNLDETNFQLGDFELMLKFQLLDRELHNFGISIVPHITFPTGTGASDFLSQGSFSGGAKLVLDAALGKRVVVALNVGYEARKKFIDVSGARFDDSVSMGLGLSVDLIKNTLRAVVEAEGKTLASDFFGDRRTTPVELRAGLRYTLKPGEKNNIDLRFGGAMGLSNGIGSPAFRVFAAVTYTKRPLAEVDFGDDEEKWNEVTLGDDLTKKFGEKIFFELDKSTIRPVSEAVLNKIAMFIKKNPQVTRIRIEGHTCDLAVDSYNLNLSNSRAQAVLVYLRQQGVSEERMRALGLGETQPEVSNIDEASREKNRRVQIIVESIQN